MERGENIPEKISRNLQEIRAYREEHSDLQEFHHFLYAAPWKHERDYALIKYDVLVISMHPGESDEDRADWDMENPAQENMEKDFHDKEFQGERAKLPWVKKCRKYLGFEMPVLETAFFFWSSPDTDEKFVEKFRYRYGSQPHSQHWEWCRDRNLELIDAIKPKLIVAMGTTKKNKDKLSRMYGLCRSSRDVPKNERGWRLAISFTLRRDWGKISFVFIPYPGRWLSTQDRKTIKETLAARLSELGLT